GELRWRRESRAPYSHSLFPTRSVTSPSPAASPLVQHQRRERPNQRVDPVRRAPRREPPEAEVAHLVLQIWKSADVLDEPFLIERRHRLSPAALVAALQRPL